MKPKQVAINAVMLRNDIKKSLIEIKDIESAKSFVYKAKTFMQYVKTTKQNAEICFLASEQKIRGERICGQLIKEGQEKGEIASQNTGNKTGNNQHGGSIKELNTSSIPIKTLSDIGLNAYESMTFQQIASIPDERFEEYIEEKREDITNTINELTTAGFIRLAKNFTKEKKSKQKPDIDEVVLKMAKDMQAWFNTFNAIVNQWENVSPKAKEKLGKKFIYLNDIFIKLKNKDKAKNKGLKLLEDNVSDTKED